MKDSKRSIGTVNVHRNNLIRNRRDRIITETERGHPSARKTEHVVIVGPTVSAARDRACRPNPRLGLLLIHPNRFIVIKQCSRFEFEFYYRVPGGKYQKNVCETR